MSDLLLAYPAIRCRDVSRVFKLPKGEHRVAVDNLSLEVPAGGVFGFLGANGAGKTTTIKMLLGFLPPTRGRLEIMGEPCSQHTTRRHIGYLPEQPYFHPFLSPAEVLKFHAELIGLHKSEIRDSIDEVLEVTNLIQNRDIPLRKLSKGNQQRVGIAQALLGSPRLLILDEPTSGLDPIGRHEMREIIARMRSEGHTVFLSSHVLSEIDTLCDRVGILKQGKLVACGSPEEVKQGRDDIVITVPYVLPPVVRELQQMDVEWEEGHVVSVYCAQQMVYPIVRIFEKYDVPLISVASEEETLENAFFRLAA